jgi:hypothetical protein
VHHRMVDRACTLANRAVEDRGLGLEIALVNHQVSDRVDMIPRNPSSGASRSGSAISALIPHTTVVSPRRTIDEPSAVDIEPTGKKRSPAETG